MKDYRDQLIEVNEKLRDLAIGLKGTDIAIKSHVVQPTISNWLRGMNIGIESLSKIAPVLGRKLVIELKQDWESGERDGLGEK